MRISCLLFSSWLSIAFAIWPTGVQADESFAFKLTPKSVSKIQREQKIEQTLNIAGNDIQTSNSNFSVVRLTYGDRQPNGSLEQTEKFDVLQVDMNLAGTMYQFDSANVDRAAPSGLEALQIVLAATFRTPITSVLDAAGKTQELRIPPESREGLPPEFASMFDTEQRKKRADQHLGLLPNRPVKIGDTWDHTIEADLGAGQTLTFGLQMTYKEVVMDGSQTRHHIELKHTRVAYSMDPNSPSPLKVSRSNLQVAESSGGFWFDAERGRIQRDESAVVVTGDLTLVAGGQEIPGTLNLKMSSKSELQPE
jgi:hypothetical protein